MTFNDGYEEYHFTPFRQDKRKMLHKSPSSLVLWRALLISHMTVLVAVLVLVRLLIDHAAFLLMVASNTSTTVGFGGARAVLEFGFHLCQSAWEAEIRCLRRKFSMIPQYRYRDRIRYLPSSPYNRLP